MILSTRFLYEVANVIKKRWNARHAQTEAGDTLVEVLIALVVIGIGATALLGEFATTISATAVQRHLVSADASLRSFVETATYDISLGSTPAFVACANSVPPAYSQIATNASNSTFTFTITGISPAPSGCSATQPPPQQISVTLSTQGVNDSTTFVVYPPSATVAAIATSVTSLSPNIGPAGGGTTVTISGNGFTGASSVSFGSVAATSFTVINNTTINAVSPAGTGAVDVTVMTGAGTSPTNPLDQFTYAPTVTGIAPTSGGMVGGTTVTITGTGFVGVSAVHFGAAAASSFSVVSPGSSITAVSPPGSAGTVDVSVTTAAGTSTASSADKFTYATTVSGISPNSGPDSGGTVVGLLGSGFTGVTSVTFGSTAATTFTVNSDTSLTATAPAGTGTVDITVTSPAGTSAANVNDRFTYTPGPPVGLGLVIKVGTKNPVAACGAGTGSHCRSPNSTTCMMTSSTTTTCDISGIWQGSNSSVTFFLETVDAAGNPVNYSSSNSLNLNITNATPTTVSIPANNSSTSPLAVTATLASKQSTTTVAVSGGGWTLTVAVSA